MVKGYKDLAVEELDIRTRDMVLELLIDEIRKDQKTLDTFSEEFPKNPRYTIEWKIENTVIASVVKEHLVQIKAEMEDQLFRSFEEAKEMVRRDKLNLVNDLTNVRDYPTSTSQGHNLVSLLTMKAKKKVLDVLDRIEYLLESRDKNEEKIRA